MNKSIYKTDKEIKENQERARKTEVDAGGAGFLVLLLLPILLGAYVWWWKLAWGWFN